MAHQDDGGTDFKAEDLQEMDSFLERLEALAVHLRGGDDSIRLAETERSVEWLKGLQQRKASWYLIVMAALEKHGFLLKKLGEEGPGEKEVFEAVDCALGLVPQALLSLGAGEGTLSMTWSEDPLDAFCVWSTNPSQSVSLRAAIEDALQLRALGARQLIELQKPILAAIHDQDLPLRGLSPEDGNLSTWRPLLPSFTFEDSEAAYEVGSRPASGSDMAAEDEKIDLLREGHVGMAMLADMVTCRIEIDDATGRGRKNFSPGDKLLVTMSGSSSVEMSFQSTQFEDSLSSTNFKIVTDRVVEMTGRSTTDVCMVLEDMGIHRSE